MSKKVVCSFIVLLLFVVNELNADVFKYDFKEVKNPQNIHSFDLTGFNSSIIEVDSGDRVLRIKNKEAGKYCRARIKRKFKFNENLALSFKVKANLISGSQISYIAIGLYDNEGSRYFAKVKPCSEFQKQVFYFSELKPTSEPKSSKNVIEYIDIYTRAGNDSVVEMYLDDIELKTSILTVESHNNPPFFNWKPVGPAVLEYSQTPNFAGNTIKVKTEYNFYTPDTPLSVGKWFWRVRSIETGRKSGVQCIVVPEKTHQFICPDIEEKLIASKSRPRFTDDIKLTTEQKKTLRNEFKELSNYTIPEDQPAFDPSKWDRWKWYSKVKRMTVMPAGKKLQRLAELYVLLKDDDIKIMLEQWTEKIKKWDPDGASSPAGGDIPSYHILRGLNHSYDALYNSMPEQQRKDLRDVIIVRASAFEKLLGNPFPVNTHKEYNNHAWLQALVLCESGLTLCGDYDRAYEWIEYTKELVVGKFLCGLGYQGESNEGIAYWGYGAKFLQKYASVLRQVTGVNLYEHPWLRDTARFPMYCAVKNSWAVSFSDTGNPNHGYKATNEPSRWWDAIHRNVNGMVKTLSRECNDPYGMWYAGEFADPLIIPRPPVDLEPSIHYEYIGWAILNTNLIDGEDGVTFAMRSGPYWSAHQHEDQNGFVINAYGNKIAVDSGYYEFYGSEHFREYSTRSKAHNVILVDGQGQDSRRAGADGKILKYFSSPNYALVLGDASKKSIYNSKLDKWQRLVIFVKPGYIILYDDLESPKHADYDWLLHSVSKFDIADSDNTFELLSGDALMRGEFLLPQKVEMKQNFGYPVVPTGLDDKKIKPEEVAKEWTLNAKVCNKSILTVLQINQIDNDLGKPEIRLIREDEDLIAFEICDTASKNIVFINKASAEIEEEQIKTDADVCVLSSNKKGELTGYFVNSGSYLYYENAMIFDSVDSTRIDASAKIENDCYIYDLSANSESSLRFGTNESSIVLDGMKTDYDQKAGLKVAGKHIVGIGKNVENYLPGDIRPISFMGSELAGYKTRSSNQKNYHWWGRFFFEKEQKLIIKLNPPQQAATMYIDDKQVNLDGSTPVKVPAGTHFIQISSSSLIEQLEVEGS